MQNEDLSRYLWKGLNLERYSVVKIIPQDAKDAVILMFSKDKDDPHWCLEYRGNGHYFGTAQQMTDYFHSRRFKHPPEKTVLIPPGGCISLRPPPREGAWGVTQKFAKVFRGIALGGRHPLKM